MEVEERALQINKMTSPPNILPLIHSDLRLSVFLLWWCLRLLSSQLLYDHVNQLWEDPSEWAVNVSSIP